ncbi:MAG: NAD(P)H-hydrate epimerase [Candidatus Thorarchaeota archaeon]|nr:NAD(P)H-hydrate epimerase [Candidatus Thorarchaeota archaeon]
MELPGITTDQMREVDRIMVEELDITIETMMELAGYNFARLAVKFLSSTSTRILVIAGSGNNGGGGVAAARRLAGWGFESTIYFPRGINQLGNVPRLQYNRAKNLGIQSSSGLPALETSKNALVLDTYLGYGFSNRDDEITDNVFSFLRECSFVLSLDIPSGLDSDNGCSYSQFSPKATMAIAFLKRGMLECDSDFLGNLFVADIGVPSTIFLSCLGITWNKDYSEESLNELYGLFSKDSLLRVKLLGSTPPFSWCTRMLDT